jgi:predicted transport protein
MLNNKADFILEYNEKTNKNLRKDDIDWTQSRVLFLANSFTPYQQNAISFRDLPIELWEVKKYSNDTILYNQLKTAGSNESIKTISKNKNIEQVSKEVKKYTLADHLKEDWEESGHLYESIREKVLSLDSRLEEKFNKFYIGFKIKTRLLCAIDIQKSKLKLDLISVDKEDLKDPENKVIKVKWEENNWGKQCSFLILNENDIDYAMFLIKQIYERLYK